MREGKNHAFQIHQQNTALLYQAVYSRQKKMAERESAANSCDFSSKTWSKSFFVKKPFPDLASSLANASTCRKRHLSALSSFQTALFDTLFILFESMVPVLSVEP